MTSCIIAIVVFKSVRFPVRSYRLTNDELRRVTHSALEDKSAFSGRLSTAACSLHQCVHFSGSIEFIFQCTSKNWVTLLLLHYSSLNKQEQSETTPWLYPNRRHILFGWILFATQPRDRQEAEAGQDMFPTRYQLLLINYDQLIQIIVRTSPFKSCHQFSPKAIKVLKAIGIIA